MNTFRTRWQSCLRLWLRAADEGDKCEVVLKILGTPRPGHTLRVEVTDNNPPDATCSMDELRFRGRSYPIGTQSTNLYVMCIDTTYDADKVVIAWEVSVLVLSRSALKSPVSVIVAPLPSRIIEIRLCLGP